jgi:hypothetical protein
MEERMSEAASPRLGRTLEDEIGPPVAATV